MIQLKITGVTEDKLTELERYELKEALGELGIFDVRTEETLKMDKNLTPPSPRDFDCVLHFSDGSVFKGCFDHLSGKFAIEDKDGKYALDDGSHGTVYAWHKEI